MKRFIIGLLLCAVIASLFSVHDVFVAKQIHNIAQSTLGYFCYGLLGVLTMSSWFYWSDLLK